MDIRIVNTCNNNCLYCLEKGYRSNDEFIDKNFLFENISKSNPSSITFYGGNPLLHPELLITIKSLKENGINNIGLLSNTFGITEKYLNNLMNSGLNHIGFYFNSFDKYSHDLVVNGGMELDTLLDNISLISKSGIGYKAIIHINKINIDNIYKDILILYKKYGVNQIDFVNIIPFEEPFDKYKDILFYKISEHKISIDKLFKVLEKLEIEANFIKFHKEFFNNHLNFYNENISVINQIPEEDIGCSKKIDYENKCLYCFMQDICKK